MAKKRNVIVYLVLLLKSLHVIERSSDIFHKNYNENKVLKLQGKLSS